MRPAALTDREIWKKKARNIHGYTTYIPCIYVKRYTMYKHGYTTYILGRYTWYIHGYTTYIHYVGYPWIYHVYSMYIGEDGIYMEYTWYIPGIY
jgi:hypothetical protein